jgi:hypothetical protein
MSVPSRKPRWRTEVLNRPTIMDLVRRHDEYAAAERHDCRAASAKA